MRKRGIQIVCRAPRRVPLAMADPERMGQALLNLCLTLWTPCQTAGGSRLPIVERKGRVCLMVRDNGTGIEPAQLPHL